MSAVRIESGAQFGQAAHSTSIGFEMPIAIAATCLTGCTSAPSQDVLGSFFPAWMLCAGCGIASAAACRILLGFAKLDKLVLAPLVGYLAVAIAVTLVVWLYRFGQ